MQYLKALNIGMGILIVLGMILLVYGFAVKSKPTPQPQQAGLSDVMGHINLDVAKECKKQNIIVDDQRLIIELGPDTIAQCAKILILDLGTGETLGTVSLYK